MMKPPFQLGGADVQRAIRNAWPQLVDFLSHHPEWVLGKAAQLLPRVDLSWAEGVADDKKKVSLVLDLFLRAADADVPIFNEFIQSICMEFNLPMELEIVFMSVSGEASSKCCGVSKQSSLQEDSPMEVQDTTGVVTITGKKSNTVNQSDHVAHGQEDFEEAATPSPSTTTTRLERRRPWSFPSTNSNGKQSKQQRLDSAERYRQLVITSVLRRYGVSRSVEAPQVDRSSAFSRAFVSLVIRHSKAFRIKGKMDKAKEDPIVLHDGEEHGSATIRLSELFESVHGGATKVILLLGKPGMGKTRLMHKICQHWAEGTFPQFQFIFFFEFRQLNVIKRKLTLRELLFDFFLQPEHCPAAVFEHLLEDAQHTLVIFDGLDEFVGNIQLPTSRQTPFPNLVNPVSVSELFASLCHGKLLPGCTVLVTTRPKIFPEAFFKPNTLLAEIWGFDREKVEEYAGIFFHQHSQKEQALACLKSNSRLLSMCYIPALCNIVCICMEYLLLQNTGSVQLPHTITQIYLKMLHTFICKQQKLSAFREEVDLSQHQATLVGLCELAFKGLEEEKMLFYAGEVPEHVKDFACLYGLLLAFEVKASNGQMQAGYTFVHFSLQEFFAALFLLTSQTLDSSSLKQRFYLRSKWTLKKEAKMPFTENCHVFLSGLSSQECRQFLSSLARQNETWIQERQAIFVQLLKKLATPQLTGPKVAELCHCVHETQDLDLARHITKRLNFRYQFRNFRLMPLDMTSLAFVINSSLDLVSLKFDGCPMELDYLDVFGSCENITRLSFRSRKYGNEFAAVLSQSLPRIKHLKSFQLAGGNITILGLEDLLQAFPNCHQLEDINLQHNRLKEQEMIKITELFSNVKRLKKLDLSCNEISVSVVLAFTRAAATCPNVTKLHIRRETLTVHFTIHSGKDPRLEDVGIKEEETIPKARTLILRLQDCQLDSQQAEEMADVVQSCSHLSEIDLSDNQLGDEGCRKLMKIVPKMCISGLLILNNNQLSMKSIFCFLSSMSVCPNIVKLKASVHHQTTTLTLVGKDLIDATLSRRHSSHDDQLKSDGRQVMTTSRKICLADNNLHGEDLKYLCLSLRMCHGVSELDLSNNFLGDPGVLKMAELLPELKALRSLTLDGNHMSLDGVICLVCFVSTLERMESMQLSLGSAQQVRLTFGEGISSLASEHEGEVLDHVTRGCCFCLRDCPVGPEDVDRLFGILTTCSGLTEINLSGTQLSDQGVEHLLTFLPCLNSLKLLSISENKFSPNGVRLLANAFNLCKRICEVEVRSSENAFLRFAESQESQELHCRLTGCGIGQDDVQELCAILEKCDHLAELDLSGNHLGNEGLRCLLEHLPKTQVSCQLKISQNRISQEGVLHLIRVFATDQNVAGISVSLCSEEVLVITLVREDKPQKILRLKQCGFQAEHLEQLTSGLGRCLTLSDFTSTNNGMMVSNAEDLFRTLRKPAGTLRIGMEEPWVKDESVVALLKMAAEVQGNITALTRDGTLFVLEQEFPSQVEKVESVVTRLHQSELQAKGVYFLPKLIGKCSRLWALNWSRVQLTDAEAAAIFDALLHFPALKRLGFTCCRIPPVGMECLAAALDQCPTIEDLDLSQSELSMNGIGTLLSALEGKHHLKSINLGSLNLDKGNFLQLTSRLSTMPLLRRLVLNNNHLGSETCSHLAEALKNAVHMEEINLSYNKIDDAGMKEIASAVLEMQNVKRIDLSFNMISAAGGQCFVEALADSKNLELLSLSGNNIGNETLEKLAPVLASMHCLKVLQLSSCKIDAEGVVRLARALFRCPQIEEISLSENTVGCKGVTAFAEHWPQSSRLRKIELKVCGISDGASKSLALWIRHCPLLEEVILSWNQLGDDSVLELGKVLPAMTKLRALDLDKNCITAQGAGRLAKELARSRGIQSIRLWCNWIPKDVEQKLGEQETRLHFA